MRSTTTPAQHVLHLSTGFAIHRPTGKVLHQCAICQEMRPLESLKCPPSGATICTFCAKALDEL